MEQDCHQLSVELPEGSWGVAVSGGADSVALLLLLASRPKLHLHVIHLDHQTRGEQSTGDANFVKALAEKLNLTCTIALRSDVEPGIAQLPKNKSARYRAARLALFRQIVEQENLRGVALAHHADDVIETALLRVLRGSGPSGLASLAPRKRINGVLLIRPLLQIRRQELRRYLESQSQPWREDASNQSDDYARNRVRKWLNEHQSVQEPLLKLAWAFGDLKQWTQAEAPHLGERFAATSLAELPPMLARESARRWLLTAGCKREDLTASVLNRLCEMATDAATAPRQQFPGNVTVRRQGGRIFRQV